MWLINRNNAHAVEPGRIVDQCTLALGEHCVVRGALRDAERFGDPGHAQVLHDDRL